MDSANYIKTLFEDSIQVKQHAIEPLKNPIADAAQLMISCLQRGGTIFSCGNGGSAADAQHFASELINRFETDRQGLAGISLSTDTSTLTSIANDSDFTEIFSRQLQALGKKNDMLLAISTSGNSANINRAVETAQQQSISTIVLSGKDGGELAQLLHISDIEIRVPSQVTARIQEVHLLVIHCLCGLIENHFCND